MQISEQWLREWVNPDKDIAAIAEDLTKGGIEVEEIKSAALPFQGVVVARVVSVEPHPGNKRFQVCHMDDGHDKNLTVLAEKKHSLAPGALLALAHADASLPDKTVITRKEIGGIVSHGRLVSESELGLSIKETVTTPLEFPQNIAPGSFVWDALQLDDRILVLSITPNRGDCLSVMGIAREIAVLNNCNWKSPFTEDCVSITGRVAPGIDIEITDPNVCPHYVGRHITDVDLGQSTPLWLKERLRRSGVRSVNAVVDITNYVMFELGQPLHAFDSDSLHGKITVRFANKNESIRLLDEKTYRLPPTALVIADTREAVALAGVMGSEASSVDSAKTKHIFLESAFFSPCTIAQQARHFNLQTAASQRFERGVDFMLAQRAIERATSLIVQICSGIAGSTSEHINHEALPRREKIIFRTERAETILGFNQNIKTTRQDFTRLGIKTHENTEASFWATPPSYRFDLSIEEDLIEEVARLRGYDAIPAHPPKITLQQHQATDSLSSLISNCKTALVERGYWETINYSFSDKKTQELFCDWEADKMVGTTSSLQLSNAISEEKSVMRTSLWPSLVLAARFNQNRQQERFRLFEAGRVYHGTNPDQQPWRVAGALLGNLLDRQWGVLPRPIDFFDVKNDVEAVLAKFLCPGTVRYAPFAHTALHPEQSSIIYAEQTVIGSLGRLHPKLQQNLEMRGDIFLFEINIDVLSSEKKTYHYHPISSFPEVHRDLALVVEERISSEEIQNLVKTAAKDLLIGLKIFDIYRGKNVPKGKKSIALELTFQKKYSTLGEEETSDLMNNIAKLLGEKIGGELRL